MSQQSSSLYKTTKLIGKGNFGSAFLCHHIDDPSKQFVMKRMCLAGISPKETRNAIQESELLRTLSSPFIVKYIDSFITRSELAIVMEYCDGGDLSQQIKKRRDSNLPYNESEIKNILFQLASALHQCHSNNILHRDVKTENVFITLSDNRMKLGDFGVSRVLSQEALMAQTVIGTPYYLSPEICKGLPYSFESDVWALGCVISELMNLHRPFEGRHLSALAATICNGRFKPLRNS